MTDRFHRDGLDLAFVDTGGSGRPVLFQHGLCGDRAQAAEAFPDGPRTRRVTLECRGHGQSPAGEFSSLTIATFANDVAALASEIGVSRAVGGGISMGAAIALRLAVTAPHLVDAMVLVRPAWAVEAAPSNMAPNRLVGELLARMPPEEARASFEASQTARRLAEEAPDNLTSIRSFFARHPLDVTAELLIRIADDGPGISVDDLAHLRIPTLVVATDHDSIHPLAHAVALARLIPGARMVQVASKADDRALYVEQLRRAIAAFLKEIDA